MALKLPPKSAAGYVCALVSIALAILLRMFLDPLIGNQFPFVTIFFAVLFTAWYGGLRPALVSVFLGVLAADFFLLPPRWSFDLGGLDQKIGLLLFVITGSGISLLGGSMHAAREKAIAIAASKHRQAALIDQSYDAVLIWDWNGAITFWNQGAERLYGFSRESAIGRVSQDLLQTNTSSGLPTLLRDLERNGRWEGELCHTSHDGQKLIIESRMVLVREEDGTFVLETNRDMTARKKAEAEILDVNNRLESKVVERNAELAKSNSQLKISEERFRMIVDGVSSHAIIILDPQGIILRWNPGAERIKGYKAEEIVGQHFSRFYTAEDIASGKPQRGLDYAIAHGRFEEEGLRVRKDGSLFWASIAISPLFDNSPEPIGFVKFTQDITERKSTEEALRASETTRRLLIEGISDYAIFMLDSSGIIVTWNAGAEQIDGYPADEIIGRHYSCLFTPESIAEGKPEKELELAAAEGRADIEGWRIRKNGSRFWANGTCAAIYGEGGKVQGFAKVTRDLTAKRQNDELLRSVLDHTLDGIISIDDHGIISMINRAGELLFGYSTTEVVGRNVDMLMPEPYHSEHDRYISNYLQTGVAKVIGIGGREVKGLRKDGSTFPMDLAITEFQLENHHYFVGIVRDVSQRKTLEAQLQQSQKMEAFGQLAAGVAHDFNNLLTVILGYSELLLLSMSQPFDEKYQMVAEIQRASEGASALTRQLLAFSRRQILDPKVLDLNSIITETEKMLRRLIGEDVQLVSVLSPNISPVKVDPGQIVQVIMNLAVNARDAMPQGGKLTIETRSIELDAAYAATHSEIRPGNFVMLSVADTGIGMTPEVKARIFEPFFTTKQVGAGTGLGLAVVYGIVKQSGGRIEVYSEPGTGSTFKIYLPAVQNSPGEASVIDSQTLHPGSETILLVEDEKMVRELGILALKRNGYKVLSAANGEAAIEILANYESTIDLLVTDVVMPEMSGRQLAEAAQLGYPNLKVLYVSGYTDDAIVRHGILQANVAFLQKPFTPNSLAKKVREVLDDHFHKN